MEQSTSPEATNSHFEDWVLESCRSCIENASLIILSQHANSISPKPTPYHSWCELQLLVGSYAVLLQVQTVPSLAPIFGSHLEIDRLLDVAETVLSRVPFVSLSTIQTLEMLKNIRYNSSISTPR
jgi:hypothetical protein